MNMNGSSLKLKFVAFYTGTKLVSIMLDSYNLHDLLPVKKQELYVF